MKGPATAALGVALFLGMVGAGLLAARDQAAALVLSDLETRFDADPSVQGISLGGLSDLPRLRIDIDGLVLVQRGALNGLELARMDRLGVTVDLLSLLSQGPLEVRAVQLENAVVKLVVDEAGHPSWAAPAGGPAALRPLRFDLDRLWLRDVDLRYENRRLVTRLDLEGLDLLAQAKGDLVRCKAEVARLRLVEGREAYIDGAPVVLDLDLTGGGDAWTLGLRKLSIDGRPMNLQGGAHRPRPDGDLELKLHVAGSGLDLDLSGTVQRPRVHQGAIRP